MAETNPYRLENPEFRCWAPREYALEAEIAISANESGYKNTRFSTLTFRTDQMSGYAMDLAVRADGEDKDWQAVEGFGEICIRFHGDYEAHTLQEFFQHVGLMMVPVYGPLQTGKEEERSDDSR